NLVHATYRLLSAKCPVRLRLRPFINFRPLEAAISELVPTNYAISIRDTLYEISAGPDQPILRITTAGGSAVQFVADGASRRESLSPMEAERVYASRGWEWSPGYSAITLAKGAATSLLAGTEPWLTVLALDPDDARRFELERRRRLVAIAHPSTRQGFPAEL